MDYLKNHETITQSEYIKVRGFIVDQLKSESENGRTADKAIANVRNLIFEKLIQPNIVDKQISYFHSSLSALINHKYNYDPNRVDPILKTLENEVFENFNTTINTFKAYNIDQENFNNLSFEKFFPEILKLVVYKRCYSRLDNSIPDLTSAIKLFYEIDKYENFSESLLQDEAEKITTERIHKIFKKHGKKLIHENEQSEQVSKENNPNPLPNSLEDDVFLNLEQTSKLIDLEKSSIYGLVHKNNIPYHKKGKRLYFLKSEIIEWLKSGKRETKSEIEARADEYLAKNQLFNR